MAINHLIERRRGILSGNAGKLVLWNQLAPDFFDTSYDWNTNVIYSSKSGNNQTWVQTYDSTENAFLFSIGMINPQFHTSGTYEVTFSYSPVPNFFQENHIYFSNFMVKLLQIEDSQSKTALTRYKIGRTSGTTYKEIVIHSLTLNQWTNCSALFVYNLNQTSTYQVYQFILAHLSSYYTPYQFLIKAPTLIDITKMFEENQDLIPEDANSFYNQCLSNNIDLTSYQTRNTTGSKIIWTPPT